MGYYFKQPLILAYILAGILLGPFGFGLIPDPDFVHAISGIGVMLMLFLVGLEMNWGRLKDLGGVSLLVSIGQISITAIVGLVLGVLFNFSLLESSYIAIALTFSSTIIAVKLMSDKKDTNSFYGQICIGVLIVQDVLAIMTLLFLAGFKEGSFQFDVLNFLFLLAKGIALGVATIVFAEKILKYLYAKIATSHELLVLFSLSWCFFISIIAMEIGFSMEIGAFIAGMSLANLPYTFEINSKAKVIRDFFITIFFAGLGAGLVFSSIGSILVPLVVISIFVLIGTPIIIMTTMGLLGYDKRNAFFVGVSLANISEFSLIVITFGHKIGHINDQITSMIGMIGMITMVVSTYMITYNEELYEKLKKYLSIFELSKKDRINGNKDNQYLNHIVILGCDQIGEQILEQILSFKEDYVVVDYNNAVIKKLMSKNINCIFGDANDTDLLSKLDLEDAEIIISTLPSKNDNYFLLKHLEQMDLSKKPIVIAIANSAREGLEMFNRGVDYIILKPYLSAHHIHSINREIYDLEEELAHVSLFGKEEAQKMNKQHKSDSELARFLHKLNALRLKEIKAKIEKNIISLKKKK